MAKPSKIKVVTAKYWWFMPSNIRAITLFGKVFCAKHKDVDLINATDEIDSQLKSHETIHVRQAQFTKNSWFVFYAKYIWQWLNNIPLITINLNAAYKFIPFELEAYRHEDEWDYCTKPCGDWKKYKALTMKQKKEFAKEYYKFTLVFSEFIKTKIDPVLE